MEDYPPQQQTTTAAVMATAMNGVMTTGFWTVVVSDTPRRRLWKVSSVANSNGSVEDWDLKMVGRSVQPWKLSAGQS